MSSDAEWYLLITTIYNYLKPPQKYRGKINLHHNDNS